VKSFTSKDFTVMDAGCRLSLRVSVYPYPGLKKKFTPVAEDELFGLQGRNGQVSRELTT
jgi:hypothetical protein